MRTHVCPICEEIYVKQKPGQKACSLPCAIALVRANREKKAKAAERKEYKAKKEALKSLRELASETQQACNKYVRLRDEDEPCISCGKHHNGQYHAGHFYTTAARPNLRFDLDNIHKQCSICNNHLSGNIHMYRPALLKKIGPERLERLDNATEVKKYTREELLDIKARFRAMTKELINERRR